MEPLNENLLNLYPIGFQRTLMRRPIEPGESVSEAVIQTVSGETAIDPLELPPLADSIDFDAVDSLFTRSPENGTQALTILYAGCRVFVEEDAVVAEKI